MGPDQLLGWRLWHLRRGRLRSWVISYDWEPGENRAECMTQSERSHHEPPGAGCQCGFWALWSPLSCAKMARDDPSDRFPVMGLVSGWGSVALHGDEGFRAERASIVCLFVDGVQAPPLLPNLTRLLGALVPGRWNASPKLDRDTARQAMLKPVADSYAVPLLPLQASLEIGILGELGVDTRQLEEVRALAQSAAG